MANVNAPNGFSLVKTQDGHMTAKISRYFVAAADATAIGIGSAVKLTGGGSDPTGDSLIVTLAAPGNTIVGVVVGFQFDPNNLMQKHRAASTAARYVYVADDPESIFEAQINGNFVAADVGKNFDMTTDTVNATTGNSAAQIDYATKGTVATLGWQVVGLATTQKNAFGTNARVLVRPNLHQYTNMATVAP